MRAVPEFAERPAKTDDTKAIYGLRAAYEMHLNGRVQTKVDDVLADLTRPAIDLARDTLLAHDSAGELAGWAWVHIGRRAEICVRPDHRGRGLGNRLLAWAEQRAREVGSGRLGQNVADSDTAAAELMHARGYAPEATSWLLEIEMGTEPVVPKAPGGITVRAFQPGDEQATYRMVEEAFREWQQRPRDYAEWAQQTIGRDTFAPALSPLAFDGDRLVGAVLSLDFAGSPQGYIDRVAVDREYRDRGIARLLLQQAFREFYRSGRESCALWTHSDTGALSLYERVGMKIRRSSTHYSKPL